jgi:uncharacterized lipoprotein YmbA
VSSSQRRLCLSGLLVVALVTATLVGCSSSPPVVFYTLTEIPSTTAISKTPAYEVLVGPVTLPETLDRPQLVARVSDTQVAVLEQQRWAAPLKSEVPRVLAANLNQLLPEAAVSVEPQPSTGRPLWRLGVDIQRLTATPGSDVTIEALWSIQGAPGTEPKIGYSVLREPVSGPGYDALVAAHTGAINALSRELAAAIQALRSAAAVPVTKAGK